MEVSLRNIFRKPTAESKLFHAFEFQRLSLPITKALHGPLISIAKVFVIDSWRPTFIAILNEIY
jgi:hypothetical protein